MRRHLLVIVTSLVLCGGSLLRGGSLVPAALAQGARSRHAPVASSKAISIHGPFAMGACAACHDGSDPARVPGRVRETTDALCFACHEEYQEPVKEHPSSDRACLGCHAPHNAKKKKLLLPD